ncbi:hypothetical protein GCM10009555_001830 [Acrocarpospora macrocephala]|uniref:Uncharacterized protein n=2 Tax=Acrocarpospora macrocephala TaxID=150177 RepID=A0A5M3X6C4_9ACTN|nr:hypothetical protein Amac_102220 [Acrocarpospora macrocephala]
MAEHIRQRVATAREIATERENGLTPRPAADRRLYRDNDVMRLLSMSRSVIYELIRSAACGPSPMAESG